MKKQIIIFFGFLFTVFFCVGQSTPLYDSALVSRKLNKVTGSWQYRGSNGDTLLIRIDKVPMKTMHPQADISLDAVIVWIYCKKGDSVIKNDFERAQKEGYTIHTRTMAGTYLDYAGAVVLSYTDPAFQGGSNLILTVKNRRKIKWEIQHRLAEPNRRHNFMYPEKLVLRRMKSVTK